HNKILSLCKFHKMIKTTTLFSVVILLCCQYIFAQVSSTAVHKPTYHELKEAGLLGNYTDGELAKMQTEEAKDYPQVPQDYDENSTRNVDPGNSIETFSPYFTISP